MSITKAAPLFLASLVFFSCASAPPPAPPPKSSTAEKAEAQNRAKDLITGESSAAKAAAPASKADAAAGSPETTAPAVGAGAEAAAVPAAELSPKEKAFLDSYLKRLKYMMVMKEGTVLDKAQIAGVLTKGNEYLLRQGFDVVHYEQMLKNMEDQRTAYEAEAGESMSLVQYVAQKLGADVYVELDGTPRSWSEGSKHFGEANFTANMYDPSTAELLGSVTYKTDRSLDSMPETALMNALVAGTAQFMPRIVRDSTNVLRNRYSNGVRYQIVIQKAGDARAVSTFRRNLRSRVREISMGPSAADLATMDVYLFGSLSDLEDACYAAFEKTPGMESAYQVYSRGKTLTFNTGA